MGNSSSTSGGNSGGNLKDRLSSKFLVSTGSLKLPKHVLDKMCEPSGLYASCSWEYRTIRKLIGDGKLAGRQKGFDQCSSSTEECPICFLNYTKVNITNCCKAYICTECFLQVRPQKIPNNTPENENGCCPFCNTPKFSVQIADLSLHRRINHQEEQKPLFEQKMIDKSSRSESFCSVATVSSCEESKHQEDSDFVSSTAESMLTPKPTQGEEFGSSLSKDLARRRTLSNLSDTSSNKVNSPLIKEGEGNTYVASTEDRKSLEEEMKKQIYHPLTRQAVSENISASNSSVQVSRNRGLTLRRPLRTPGIGRAREQELTEMMRVFDNEGVELQGLDDLVLLEAAILMAMEDQGQSDSSGSRSQQTPSSEQNNGVQSSESSPLTNRRQRIWNESRSQRLLRLRGANVYDNGNNYFMRGISEEEQIEMAIAMSLRDMGGSANGNETNDEENNSNTSESHVENDNQDDNNGETRNVLGTGGSEASNDGDGNS